MKSSVRSVAQTALSHGSRVRRRAVLSAAVVVCIAAVCSSTGMGCAHELVAVNEPAAGPACSDTPVVHSGRATYYTFADGGGSCMFEATPGDLMVAAMNASDYEGAFVWGMTVIVSGPKGNVSVRIVDKCPECTKGSLDLSPQAFAAIGDPAAGNIPITWTMTAAAVSGPIAYHFKAESNQWWTAVQVRNHRYPVRSLEYRDSHGTFIPVARTDYNYFVAPEGMGPGPFTFRVKDYYGRTLIDSGIVHAPNVSVSGTAQFPLCTQ